MSARVINSAGKIITQTKDFGDWRTMHYVWGKSYREMPGDRILLKPKEKVVRVVPLNSILSNLSELPQGLQAGEYKVQLMLGDIVSNEMKLKIVPMAK